MATVDEISAGSISNARECQLLEFDHNISGVDDEHENSDGQPQCISDDSDSGSDDNDRRIDDEGALQCAHDGGSHPFLDMEEQRQRVEMEKAQRRAENTSKQCIECALPPEHQIVALKLLLREGHRLQRLRGEIPAAECDRMWREIGAAAVRDVFVEGHAFVQRRLSCMCLFNPRGGRKEYTDSDAERLRRQANQHAVLNALRMQAATGGSRAFLKSPVVTPSPSVLGDAL